jgi:3-oxoacyl-[acyl-carrier protein] reductase
MKDPAARTWNGTVVLRKSSALPDRLALCEQMELEAPSGGDRSGCGACRPSSSIRNRCRVGANTPEQTAGLVCRTRIAGVAVRAHGKSGRSGCEGAAAEQIGSTRRAERDRRPRRRVGDNRPAVLSLPRIHGSSETIVPMFGEQVHVALVTGSSRGLGAAIARRLAQDGIAVAVNGLHDDGQALEVVRSIRDGGGVADSFPADITDEQQVTRLVSAIADQFGSIDVLVLNATGPQPEAPLTDVAWADHLAQLDFFVKSPVLLARAVLPNMMARRFGRVVNIDSEVADRPPPGRSAYATAKSAQIGLTRSWARELAPFAITVNTVAPGFVPVERHADVPVEVRDAYLASVPVGRMGTPIDIAHAVSFLASEGAGFITGQRIVVDGGRSLSA